MHYGLGSAMKTKLDTNGDAWGCHWTTQRFESGGGWQLKIWVYEDSESQGFRKILEILRASARFCEILRDSESSFPQNSARGATSPWPSFCTEVCTMLRSGRSSVSACSIPLIDMQILISSRFFTDGKRCYNSFCSFK
jgi:hypothetical protein